MKAMHVNEDFRVLSKADFQNQYILVLDLTSLQDAAEQLHYPERSGESLREETFFQFPLKQVTEMIVLVRRISKVRRCASLTASAETEKLTLILCLVVNKA